MSKKTLRIILFTVLCIIACISAFGVYIKISQGSVIKTYTSNVAKSNEDIDKNIAKVEKYNERIKNAQQGVFNQTIKEGEYEELFSENNGMIGIVNVPKIGLRLPIYHGTEESELIKGVGHVDYTALPIDTVGTRSMLTGHNGVPGTDMLFTRLDEIVKGDVFTTQVGNQVYHYTVTQIHVLTPEETEEFARQNPLDTSEVVLMTCTPYGINSHRLLLVGEFVKKSSYSEAADIVEDQKFSIGKETLIIIGLTIIVSSMLAYSYIEEKESDEK